MFWYKKTVIPKKKYIVPRNLKDSLPNLPLRKGKSKKKIPVFLSRQFCDSLKHEQLKKIDEFEISTNEKTRGIVDAQDSDKSGRGHKYPDGNLGYTQGHYEQPLVYVQCQPTVSGPIHVSHLTVTFTVSCVDRLQRSTCLSYSESLEWVNFSGVPKSSNYQYQMTSTRLPLHR